MRIEVLQGLITRLILDEHFRQHFFDNRDQVLGSSNLTDEERGYFREYTPEQLYAFVGGMAAHQLVPIHASRRVVILPDDFPAPTNGLIGIRLAPGAVFGNGIHPSTQLCLDALEHHLKVGDSVLDVGTGTGILAIAAAKLGAKRVLAVDVLSEAIREASINIQTNEVQHIVSVMQGSFDCAFPPASPQPFRARVVLANMLPPVLLRLIDIGLLDTIQPKGVLIMSGMRDWEHPPVEQALRARGARLTKHSSGEWVSFSVRRPIRLPWNKKR